MVHRPGWVFHQGGDGRDVAGIIEAPPELLERKQARQSSGLTGLFVVAPSFRPVPLAGWRGKFRNSRPFPGNFLQGRDDFFAVAIPGAQELLTLEPFYEISGRAISSVRAFVIPLQGKSDGDIMYLKSFDYFRAVTIVLIVAGHCYGISGWKVTTFSDRVLANIISGGTSLFVFISGFLFHHVFYKRYSYFKFIKGKIKNVYSPYICVSIIPIAYSIYTKNPYPEFYFGSTDTLFDQVLRPTFLYFWYGGVLVYWYIPFIMTMFLISPLFMRFIRLRTNLGTLIVAVLSLVAVFVHRPINNLSILQSVVYFLPVYLFGILCSMERDWIYARLQGKNLVLLAGVLFLAMLQAVLMDTCGNLQKNPFDYNGVDVSFLQKIVLCVLLMNFLHRYEDRECRVLERVASASFAIYFLHGWVIFFIWKAREHFGGPAGFFLLPLFTALVTWISYAVAAVIKKWCPEKSRSFIGW